MLIALILMMTGTASVTIAPMSRPIAAMKGMWEHAAMWMEEDITEMTVMGRTGTDADTAVL